ncbi:MAG: phosphatidylserine decarboxylase [Myxococcales bacterium]|nr:phosphatidylserine decarboxylase [Myxococcales bacterium]
MSAATYAAAQLLKVLPRVRISRAVGRLCEKPLAPPMSRAIERVYSSVYRVNMGEAAPKAGAYRNFDEFFTRNLKPGARRISDDVVVSPADGVIEATGPIDSGCRVFVKGRPYDVAELVGDSKDATRFAGGGFAVVYLSPRDYHRVHSPVEGELRLVRGIPGDLYPVNKIGERHFPRLFVRNNRVAIAIDTAGLGRVYVIMVGAVIVGRISVQALDAPAVPAGDHLLDPPSSVKRGDELGTFHLGSTAVLLVEPGITLARSVGPIRYGESLLKPA